MTTNIKGLINIHKQSGKLRPTCRRVTCKADIPAELINSGAVTVDGNSVTMIAVEGPATRQFPFFLSWETTEKTASGYGAWPKDNGATTLIVDAEGHCYDKAPVLTAYVLQFGQPIHEHFATMENITVKDGMCKVATSWGEVREAPMPTREEYTAVLIDYGDGVNLLTLSEPSAEEYIVQKDGKDIGRLLDVVKNKFQ